MQTRDHSKPQPVPSGWGAPTPLAKLPGNVHNLCPTCDQWGEGSCARADCPVEDFGVSQAETLAAQRTADSVQYKLANMEATRPSTSTTFDNAYTPPALSLPDDTVGNAVIGGEPAYVAQSGNVYKRINGKWTCTYRAPKEYDHLNTTTGDISNSTGSNWKDAYGKGWKHSCMHSAKKMITRIGDAEVHIGALRDIDIDESVALLIQCAETTSFFGTPLPDKDVVLPPRYETLRAHVNGPKADVIVLPWEDMHVPPFKPSFWPELVKLLPAGKVVLACQGGHGRSGTALACLLVTAHNYTAKRAIMYVRKEHCKNAIETKAQEGYIYNLALALAN